MSSPAFLLIYLLCNAFRAYILYLFLKIFFTEKISTKKIEILSYVLFFVINSAVYYLIKVPFLNLFVNIVGFFLLTFNYKGSVTKRLVTVFLIYTIMFCIEVALSYFFSNIRVEVFIPNTKELIFIPISTTIILYVISLLINKLRSLKSQIKIPYLYWIMLAGIPVSSLYILILLLQSDGLGLFPLAICATLVLFINFSVFYLYDKVIAELNQKIEKELLRQENILYNRQLEQMESALNTTRKMQHDIRNHWMAISSLAENKNNFELVQYMKEINPEVLQPTKLISTGNKSIDSILNYKLQEAKQLGITVKQNILIPENLNIASSDCVIILGNLLDNAIQATSILENNKFISLNLKYNRGCLLLDIENSFSGEILLHNNKIITSKEDKESHGYGLGNVKATVEKYQGSFNISHNHNIFKVSIIMYIK